MGRPQITVRIAFGSNPLDTPVWTDVSSYVRAISMQRGRQRELDRIEAGTAHLTLSNQDGRFDPTNSSSPYWPNVKPARRINIRATWAGTTYDLFTGYIENWPPDYPNSQDSTVEIAAVDAFKFFATKKISLSRNQEYSNWRIDALLNAVGWRAADRALYSGQSLMQAVVLDRTPILQHLQDVATSENGVLFIKGGGEVEFQGRHYRLNNPTSITNQATFGSQSGELPYVDAELSYDDTNLYNEIIVDFTNGAPQTEIDATSQATYFPRTLSRMLPLITTTTEAQAAATWLLNRYATPMLRIDQLQLRGMLQDSALWPQVLGRTLSDRVTARVQTPSGTTIEQLSTIEQIAHQITRDDWLTTWQLSPVASLRYWTLGSSTNSVLATTTIPAY